MAPGRAAAGHPGHRGGHCRYARTDLLAVLRLRGGRKILPRNAATRHGNPDLGRRQVAAVPRKLTAGRRRAHRTGVNTTGPR